MARKPTDKRGLTDDPGEDLEGNVDKIRQILFGGQMRDYEERFEAMEKRLTRNIERAATDLERRLERVDAYARREVEKLAEQLKSEKKDRTAENKKGIGELQSLIDQVEKWFAEVDEQLEKDAKDFRAELLDHGEELKGEIRERHEKITALLQEQTEDLAGRTLAREDMASVLAELAVRLNKDVKIPK